MIEQGLPTLGEFAALATLGLAWVTMVRWTRDSREGVEHQLRRQFWIDHSVDLEYGVGRGPEITHGAKELVIRGIELYDYGWWFSPIDPDWNLYGDRTRWDAIKTRLRLGSRRVAYGLYRNLVPGANLWMEISLLVEARNCTIYQHDIVERTDVGVRYDGNRLTDEFPEIRSFSPDIRNRDLYKIGLSTYDWYEADAIIIRLAASDFMKNVDFDAPSI